MTGTNIVRVLLGAIGVALLIGGAALGLYYGAEQGVIVGAFWMIVVGVVLVIAAAIEVTRYRSQAAEHDHVPPGPGGGETTPLESRFRSTDEIFVDPTSHLRMRVFLDAKTGERRYVAEG